VLEFNASPWFPPTVWLPDASLPIPRVPSGRVPRLRRYYQGATTPCRPSRRTSFSFVWRYHGCTRLSLPHAGECRHVRAWSWSPGSSGRELPWRRQDLPCSWGTPNVPLPCSPTPADRPHQALAMRRHGPHSDHKEGYRNAFSRLNHTALTLAVYASPDGSPHRDARLASGCWLGSTGRA